MTRHKFRVTLWFKKGAADADEAAGAADSDDTLHPGAVDLLPAEDRYLDDGSVTREDSLTFSLRTGHTSYLPKLAIAGGTTVSTGEGIGRMVRDMKRGRLVTIAVLGAAMAAVGAMVMLYAI